MTTPSLVPHSHGGGSSLVPEADRGERFRSFDVADFPIPTGREEDWRFTPLDRVRGLHDGTFVPGGKVLVEVDPAPGVLVESVSRDDARLGTAGVPADRVAAAAWSSFESATVVTVPQELSVPDATLVTVRGEDESGAAFGHLLVDARPFSSATVVVDHRGSATFADNLEIRVGESARLTVVIIEDWDSGSVHLTQHSLRLAANARLRHVVVSLGGDVVRVAPCAAYDGPGGELEMFGLYFADAGQHLEHRLFLDHAVPHCRSNVLYKGALQGADAHTVWVGDVLIRAAAEGTSTYEHNRNLVLTDGARADSVPNLEIETGEIVGAGHASATGRFDDEQLFYLQARGIPEDEARRLVVRGFFAELLGRIGVPHLEERLLGAIESRLGAAEAGAA